MINAILTDIEGTTSCRHFVQDVMLPYTKDALPEFVETHQDDPIVAGLLEEILEQAALSKGACEGRKIPHKDEHIRLFSEQEIQSLIETLLTWIADNNKSRAFKALQSLIWTSAYKNGDFKAPIYADAKNALENWHKDAVPVYVFSNASIKAQSLFFSYSEYGDLSYLFSEHFNGQIGPTGASASYLSIADTVAHSPKEILFISNCTDALDAAKQAGLKTCLITREEDRTSPECSAHPMISSLEDIKLFQFA